MDALTAQKRAHKMANEEFKNRPRWKKWVYTIKDNPYYRKHPMHTIWHNAFYDECKALNRSIK